MPEAPTFMGRVRNKRTTRRSVLIADKLARFLISAGGIGTIVAVMGVCVFLVWVVLPLFLPATLSDLRTFEVNWPEEPLHLGVDEYQVLYWVLLPSGRVELFRLDTGERLLSEELFEEGRMSAASFLVGSDMVTFGLADGIVRSGRIGFDTTIRDLDQLPERFRQELLHRPPGRPLTYEQGVVQLTVQGQARIQQLAIELATETRISNTPVRRVQHVIRSGGPLLVALTEDETQPGSGDPPGLLLLAIAVEESTNFLTGATTMEFADPVELPFKALNDEVPAYLAVAGSGGEVYVGWESGHLLRIRTADLDRAFIAEEGRLVDDGVELTALGFILGHTTMVWGDSTGKVEAGFPVRLEELESDGVPGLLHDPEATTQLVATKVLATGGAAARAFAPSARSRLLLTGFADGTIALSNVTNAARLTKVRVPSAEAVVRLMMAPKEDGLIALTRRHLIHGRLDPRYPESSFRALFRPVWYEGYSEPQHLWQSSSATDDFEPKLGLWPLVFGTLKATFYSMIFGAPLALLAAVFTSEFLGPRAKAAIKPTIELMASLPSVVLGFLAALVFAPFIEKVLPATLALCVTLPLVFLLGAYVWQLLPATFTLRIERRRFAGIVLVMPLGVVLAAVLGPLAETLLFAGDFKGWLAWEPGAGAGDEAFRNAVGGWMLLWLPLSAFVTACFLGRFVAPRLRVRGARWGRRRFARVDLGKFVVAVVSTIALA
ncbi:MAG: hypothetical protein GY856_41835, partial [bacterium]|nr:hypothetical protein [bacterium]